jgi:serine/threonine-protein kinase
LERIGRYEVVGHLAAGGMGQVYLARATGLGGFERQVVVKTLDPETIDDDSFVNMFLDEARLLGALHHQYIAPVYEVGRDDRGRYFLVMEYVRGETAETAWKAAIRIGPPAPLPFALTVVAAVASALDYAHSLSARDGTPLDIVHRDVSLSNIMIGLDGGVKLIDFGIAKYARRTTKTQIGSLKGKLAYLSPEQVLSKPVDHRADIFALGIVLYELTTLVRAFDGESELIMLEKITKGEVPLPSQIVPDYPRELERIVMKALAVDPDLRYQDAGTMGRELEAFAARESLLIGHGAIVETMKRLFEPAAPGGRRRFARASSEVDTGRHEKSDPDLDITPIEGVPIDLDDTTRPRSADSESVPTLLAPTGRSAEQTIPIVTLTGPPPAPPAPLIIRIGTPPPMRAPSPPPSHVATVTAQVPRKPRPRFPNAPSVRWWWPFAFLAVVMIVALIVAIV